MDRAVRKYPAGDVDRTAERKEDRSVASETAQCTRAAQRRPGRIAGLRTVRSRSKGEIEGAARSVALPSALSGVSAMIETMPLEKAADAYARMMAGRARFRMVLTMG